MGLSGTRPCHIVIRCGADLVRLPAVATLREGDDRGPAEYHVVAEVPRVIEFRPPLPGATMVMVNDAGVVTRVPLIVTQIEWNKPRSQTRICAVSTGMPTVTMPPKGRRYVRC